MYRQRHLTFIDPGRRPGSKSFEVDPLVEARRRIKELEAELKIVKAASALFDKTEFHKTPTTMAPSLGPLRHSAPGRGARFGAAKADSCARAA